MKTLKLRHSKRNKQALKILKELKDDHFTLQECKTYCGARSMKFYRDIRRLFRKNPYYNISVKQLNWLEDISHIYLEEMYQPVFHGDDTDLMFE